MIAIGKGAMNPIFLFRTSTCRPNGKPAFAIPAWVLCLALGAATLGLNSCGTARGFGNDVEHVGNKIEDAASRR